MSTPKVSIIIPVFNMESFLPRCLESTINQSYSNLEIIIINDGSSDTSPKIIDEYASKDNRIIAIHKENGGIGSAYKAAFNVMSGDYVLFVDSDDWLELNAVENLIKHAQAYDADLVSFGIRAFDAQGNDVKLPTFNNLNLVNSTNEAILKTHFEILKHPTLVRLYKREIFKNLVVFEQNIGIDELLTPQLLLKCSKAVYTSDVYYNVLVRPTSVCRQRYTERKIQETLKVHQFLIEFFKTNIPQYKYYEYNKYLLSLFDIILYRIKSAVAFDKDLEKQIISEFRSLLFATPLSQISKNFSARAIISLPFLSILSFSFLSRMYGLIYKKPILLFLTTFFLIS